MINYKQKNKMNNVIIFKIQICLQDLFNKNSYPINKINNFKQMNNRNLAIKNILKPINNNREQ